MAKMNLDFDDLPGRISSQFQGLNPNEPGQWPLLPKVLSWLAAGALVCVAAWFTVLSATQDALVAEEAKEEELKTTYRGKLAQAINLDELRKQKLQVQEYVTQLERQLPGKAEMDALLSDINQAGLGRGLQFDLFRPGQVVVKDYYVELPISLRVTGRFHDIGNFTADVANLSRIVTLHNLALSTPPPSAGAVAPAAGPQTTANLVMEATARTYRYLDPAELEANRKSKTKGPDGKPAGGQP
jgi:type IV pilus assembly protein PilO